MFDSLPAVPGPGPLESSRQRAQLRAAGNQLARYETQAALELGFNRVDQVVAHEAVRGAFQHEAENWRDMMGDAASDPVLMNLAYDWLKKHQRLDEWTIARRLG